MNYEKIICKYDRDSGAVYTEGPFGDIYIGFAALDTVNTAPDLAALVARVDRMLEILEKNVPGV